MKTKRFIPVEYRHWLPYSYTHLEKREESSRKLTDLKVRKGAMPSIQNNESQIITFYKNISRF